MSEQMDLTERKLSREDKFAGRIVTVHVDTVELPNGGTSTREVVDHPGGVAVITSLGHAVEGLRGKMGTLITAA